MKRRFMVLLALVMAVNLASCQKLPDSLIVVGKTNDQLLEAASGNEEEKKGIAEMLNMPDRMILSVADAKGDISVNVDADITRPGTDSIPVVRVRSRDFTQEEADCSIAYFIGDAAFNDRYEAGYSSEEERLMQWIEELAMETDPAKGEELRRSIDKFKLAGIEIPDKPHEVLPASKVFKQAKQGVSQITGYAKDKGDHKYLGIVNQLAENKNMLLYTCEQKGYADIGHEASYYTEASKGDLGKLGLMAAGQMPLSISPEDARNKAAEALRALNIPDMELYSCEEVWGSAFLQGGVVKQQERHAYRLEFVRSLGGTLLTYAENNIGRTVVPIDERTGERLAASWPYERVMFIIDDTGIVEFLWESPYEVMEQVVGHTKLMPFEDIQDIFSTMILVTHAQYGEDVKLAFNIDQVQLGMARIQENDDPVTGLIVPVWDFFGTMAIEYDGGQELLTEHVSHLTVNAIDGSIIDRTRGY
ncbi:MAG TPA: hypothetical protein GXX75_01815 [Clostridiales bacterium]|nr:hypothetical protein [Clostridiales bacterium]